MNFVLNVCGAGAMGDDARLASREAWMAQECKETRDAMMAHRRQHSIHLSKAASS
jgi:hypothetical protein